MPSSVPDASASPVSTSASTAKQPQMWPSSFATGLPPVQAPTDKEALHPFGPGSLPASYQQSKQQHDALLRYMSDQDHSLHADALAALESLEAASLSPTRTQPAAGDDSPTCNGRTFSSSHSSTSSRSQADPQQAWPSAASPELALLAALSAPPQGMRLPATSMNPPPPPRPQLLQQNFVEQQRLQQQLQQLLKDQHIFPSGAPSVSNTSAPSSSDSLTSPAWVPVSSDPSAVAATKHPDSGNTANGGSANSPALPCSINVTLQTDMMQAAGLVSFALSQPGTSTFMLATHSDLGPTSSPILSNALRIALCARKLVSAPTNQQAAQGQADLGIVPILNSDAVEGLSLLVCRVPSMQAPGRNALLGGGQTFEIHAGSNPLLASLSLLQAVGIANSYTGGLAAVEVLFSADAAAVALQALATLRLNLSSQGRDVVLLPHLVDWLPPTVPGGSGGYPSSNGSTGALYHVSLLLSAQLLPCFRWQLDPMMSGGPTADCSLDASGVGRHTEHPSMPPLPLQQQQHNGWGTMESHWVPPQGGAYHCHANQIVSSSGNGINSGHSLGLGSNSHSGASLGGGMYGQLPPTNKHVYGASGDHKGVRGGGGGGLSGLHQRNGGLGSVQQLPLGAAVALRSSRVRKADYVIVTDDTAIKNAAGAIAKVLGRIALQGQSHCCPVYLEKKTDQWTLVVSVAVKAIAVARGYVANEGTRHEVGFQPYQRHTERPPSHSEHYNSLTGRPIPNSSHSSGQYSNDGLASLFGPPCNSAAGVNSGHLFLAGHGNGHGDMNISSNGGSGGYGDEDAQAGLMMPDQQRCEFAFDVYRLPQLPEVEDVNNLPVKVTAHSRSGVVSNIICKLVNERDTAVLITAGGKAMHVAMAAVVAARAKLCARGTDIILLPRFVTVDTTSTLGWESVFLKFRIVRCTPNSLNVGSGSGSSEPLRLY